LNNPVSGLPPTRPLSTAHSPSTVGDFAGGSFKPGADTESASPRKSVVDMSVSSLLLGPLQGNDDPLGTFGGPGLGRPRPASLAEAEGECVAVELVNPEDHLLLLLRRRGQVNLGRVLLRVELVGPGVRLLALPLRNHYLAVLGKRERDAPLGDGQVLAPGDRLLAVPGADDTGLLLGGVFARGPDGHGQAQQKR